MFAVFCLSEVDLKNANVIHRKELLFLDERGEGQNGSSFILVMPTGHQCQLKKLEIT